MDYDRSASYKNWIFHTGKDGHWKLGKFNIVSDHGDLCGL